MSSFTSTISLYMFFSSFSLLYFVFFFFFNDPATTEIYTLSLHDALPISSWLGFLLFDGGCDHAGADGLRKQQNVDRKSTRLNSSHTVISYAVFCLKKKKKKNRKLDRNI